MTKLETIPAEEGATLLPKPKPTGIRRVVAVSAMVSGGLQTDGTCGCACQCRSGMPAELRNSAGPCKLGGKEITIQNGEGLCVTASGHKNGAKILAKKCKDGSSTQQWQIGPM